MHDSGSCDGGSIPPSPTCKDNILFHKLSERGVYCKIRHFSVLNCEVQVYFSKYKKAEVLVLSNLSDQERIATAVSLGVFEYMVKVDWNVVDVVKKIRARLGFNGEK